MDPGRECLITIHGRELCSVLISKYECQVEFVIESMTAFVYDEEIDEGRGPNVGSAGATERSR